MGNRSRALVIALGIFFVGVAALAKFYAYPTLAVAPADQIAHTVSVGQRRHHLQRRGSGGEDRRRPGRRAGPSAATWSPSKEISKALDREVVVFDTAVVTDDDPRTTSFPRTTR